MKESKGEKACRVYFEDRFGKKFIRCRPEWLDGLELDGYCEELNLAFEYNGGQHYRFTPHFHKGDCKEFHAQVKRDVDKRKVCAKRDIKLIIVPDVKAEYVPSFLDIEFMLFEEGKKDRGCASSKCCVIV